MIFALIFLSMVAFSATLLSIVGEPRRKDGSGFSSITKIGWWLIVLALLAMCTTIFISYMSNKQSSSLKIELDNANKKMDEQRKKINIKNVAIDIPSWIFSFSSHARLNLGSMVLEISNVNGGAYIDSSSKITLRDGSNLWAGMGSYNAVTRFSAPIIINKDRSYGFIQPNITSRIHLDIELKESLEAIVPFVLSLEFQVIDEKIPSWRKFLEDKKTIYNSVSMPYYVFINKNREYLLNDDELKLSDEFGIGWR